MSTQARSAPPPPEQGTNVERWGWYSIAVNVALALINLVVALASGSLAVKAEMVHNAVDLLTAIGVLIGLKLATRKSKAFPYGLYKVENVTSVVLGVMTFVTAYEIARYALFAQTHLTTVNAWMLGGVLVATAIPLIFSHFELRAGRAANSPAPIADAREYRAHVFTTGVVLAALVGQWFNLPLDRFAALVIVLAMRRRSNHDPALLLYLHRLQLQQTERERELWHALATMQRREWLGGGREVIIYDERGLTDGS